jgi:glutaredoxin
MSENLRPSTNFALKSLWMCSGRKSSSACCDRPDDETMTDSVKVDIYSRPGCHLCDEAKEVIERVGRRVAFTLRVINIETDPELEKKYGEEIPVVFVNGMLAFKYRVDDAEFEKKVKRLWKT